jgi:hypothetical protein
MRRVYLQKLPRGIFKVPILRPDVAGQVEGIKGLRKV